MSNAPEVDGGTPGRAPLGWRALAAIAGFQAAALAVATYPMVRNLRSALPEAYDSLQHLWLLRWYKTCLLEGRSPFLCPQLQYPIGAPLGGFSPLHLQALLYLPLSSALGDDILCYNLLWAAGLLLTGLGTSLLIWELLGDRACAAFGGLLAMLSGPVTTHAHGHLELIYVGTFPLFLTAWIRFVDRPSRGRLAAAAAGYVLVAMSAAYYMVFAVFPAALYVAWCCAGEGRRGALRWLRGRVAWLLGFVAASLPCLIVLFSGHLWAVGNGHSVTRTLDEFALYRAPLWSYLSPTAEHWLGSLLPFDFYDILGSYSMEGVSYLGVVTVALMICAGLRRTGIRCASYLWGTFALMVLLSLGATCDVGGLELSLPSAWLWHGFPAYRLTRVPARFNLFAAVLAGVLAAAGLRHLLARLPGGKARWAAFAALAVLAVADLARVPFWSHTVPAMPGCYAFLKQRNPDAKILEVPYFGSSGSCLNAACTYWQSLHGLTTSAGYSGHLNEAQARKIGHNSPFAAERLARPDYLHDPSKVDCYILSQMDLQDYIWLYLTINGFDYVVLHQWKGSVPELPVRIDRLKALLAEAKVFEDEKSVVYDRSRLKPPSRPVVINLDGWDARGPWQGRWNSVIPNRVKVAAYNPDPARDLTFAIDASSLRRYRQVRVLAGSKELASWTVAFGSYQNCVSPTFRLPSGLQELTIKCEGRRPYAQGHYSLEEKPYSLRVARVSLDAVADPAPIAAQGRGERTVR